MKKIILILFLFLSCYLIYNLTENEISFINEILEIAETRKSIETSKSEKDKSTSEDEEDHFTLGKLFFHS